MRRCACVLRVHRIPFSTNVERVALAAGHKGLDVEWIDHDPRDRSAIRALSGQELVPVAEVGSEVIADSTRIVERLEQLFPDPPLYPSEPTARARVDLFLEWFDEVWKRPPNQIEAELRRVRPDSAVIAAAASRMRSWLASFEDLLVDGAYLFGEAFGAADVCAFPFLKYSLLDPDPADHEQFHRVLREHLELGDGHLRLRSWITRVDRKPRA